ncbi:unnamed protein product [Acanthosepion pharaonis]|uniref:Uncharacterized protein n=1 Tax=Acanthosepion pharaonis TaxID=158019 RepID=A0A812EV66_ACAPH|nr:unnamed protein product [Sepia pharaonis]
MNPILVFSHLFSFSLPEANALFPSRDFHYCSVDNIKEITFFLSFFLSFFHLKPSLFGHIYFFEFGSRFMQYFSFCSYLLHRFNPYHSFIHSFILSFFLSFFLSVFSFIFHSLFTALTDINSFPFYFTFLPYSFVIPCLLYIPIVSIFFTLLSLLPFFGFSSSLLFSLSHSLSPSLSLYSILSFLSLIKAHSVFSFLPHTLFTPAFLFFLRTHFTSFPIFHRIYLTTSYHHFEAIRPNFRLFNFLNIYTTLSTYVFFLSSFVPCFVFFNFVFFLCIYGSYTQLRSTPCPPFKISPHLPSPIFFLHLLSITGFVFFSHQMTLKIANFLLLMPFPSLPLFYFFF